MSETSMKRRVLLRGTLTAGTLGVAVGAGLLRPVQVLAAWPKSAFEAKSIEAALTASEGTAETSASEKITVKAPDIAENGAVVPITVSTDLPDVESIAILASENNSPLVARFELMPSSKGYVSTRIKMAKTSDVVAVVKSGGNLHSASKSVKVTIGGCGG